MRQSSPVLGRLGWLSTTAYGGKRSHGPEEDEEEGNAGHPHRHQHGPHEDDVGPAPRADMRVLHEGVFHCRREQGLVRLSLKADSNAALGSTTAGSESNGGEVELNIAGSESNGGDVELNTADSGSEGGDLELNIAGSESNFPGSKSKEGCAMRPTFPVSGCL